MSLDFFPFVQTGVTFDEPTHRYRYFGQPVHNVTTIMRAHKLSGDLSHIPEPELTAKRELGLEVHTATHYDDEGELDHASVTNPRAAGYIEAWRLFKREQDFEALLLECRLVHPAKLDAGTLDRWGIVHRLDRSGLPAVVDLKTGDPDDARAEVQTAAYEDILRALLPELYEHLSATRRLPWTLQELRQAEWPRYSVQLLETGKYKLHTYPNYQQDLQLFEGARICEVKQHPSWLRRAA